MIASKGSIGVSVIAKALTRVFNPSQRVSRRFASVHTILDSHVVTTSKGVHLVGKRPRTDIIRVAPLERPAVNTRIGKHGGGRRSGLSVPEDVDTVRA